MTDAARGWRWLGALGGVSVGAVIGVTGAFVQSQRALVELPWGSWSVPWGVPVVWIALVAAVRGGAWALRSRWGAWAVMAGWLGMTILLSAESPSGDVAVSGGGRQLVYLMGGVILASAAATLPVPRSAAESRTVDSGEPTA